MAKITKKEKHKVHYNLRLTEDEAYYLYDLCAMECGSEPEGSAVYKALGGVLSMFESPFDAVGNTTLRRSR